MTKVFADAHYWVAILNDQDQSHAAAEALRNGTLVSSRY